MSNKYVAPIQMFHKMFIDAITPNGLDLSAVDRLLEETEINSLDSGMIMCYLRCTSHCKNKLKNWNIFLIRGKEIIDSRGDDSKSLLIGLLN